MSLTEDVRPMSRSSPSRWWKIGYSRRSDTAGSSWGAGGHQSLLFSGVCSFLEPHRVRRVSSGSMPWLTGALDGRGRSGRAEQL